MSRINLYFRKQPTGYKFVPGDRYLVNLLRRLFKQQKVSGVEKVFVNLCKGFNELNIDYTVNHPFNKIKADEPVIVLGVGKYALQGYTQPNPIIAGIGLMTHPHEWPGLFKEYPVAKYLQPSMWTNNVYVPYYGVDKCLIWPSGIDTDKWSPDTAASKTFDFLIYNKIMWDYEQTDADIRKPILEKLGQLNLTYQEITYGQYQEQEYFSLLKQCRAMIFLCEHESQGFACGEALSMDIPVLAWDQGYWLDPNRFKWNDPIVKATSVPYFDKRCGMPFKDITGFEKIIAPFWDKVKARNFNPRTYILENLTLKKSAEKMLEIVKSVYK